MEIYLIRHGDAVARTENEALADADRPLTELGQSQAQAVGAGLQRRGVMLHVILASPLLRARQTAEGILKAWTGTPPALQTCEELSPNYRPRKLVKALKDFTAQHVALIGHDPDLPAWAAWAIGSRKAKLVLAKAGVAHLTFPEGLGKGMGTLMQLVTPDWMG